MGEFARRVISGLALLAGALVFWYIGDLLFDLTRTITRQVGPVWSLAAVGALTLLLATVWVRYGGAGALGRWGVTIKPASPPHPTVDTPREDVDRDAGRDLPGTAGRRGPGPSR